MTGSALTKVRDDFFEAANEWITDFYHIEFRYVAKQVNDHLEIVNALVTFYPWINEGQDPLDYNFRVNAGDYIVGQKIVPSVQLAESRRVLEEALDGVINLTDLQAALFPRIRSHHLWGKAPNPWFNMINLSVSSIGGEQNQFPQSLDDDLRRAEVPFDGYSDVLQWLSLNQYQHPGGIPCIAIAVYPPAQIIVPEGSLANGKLKLMIDVMPTIDASTISVAVMGSPPQGITLRKQVKNDLEWAKQADGQRVRGAGTIELPSAYAALVALSVGNTYVQRQWFRDPTLSQNIRYTVSQQFDHDLVKIRERLKSTDSRAFEKAVAALLFICGFAAQLPLVDESPDVIGVTPGGQVVLVECTLKTTDVISKVGNLVSRREALRATFVREKRSNPVHAVLVCQSPRSHIPQPDVDLANHDILLITQESIEEYLVLVQNQLDADELCARWVARLQALKAGETV